MKIAIPTRNNAVDDHFGHCESYTIFTLNEKKEITDETTLPSLQGCGCKSNIIPELKRQGVSVMLAGNMGNGAYNKLTEHGIRVFRGCSGQVNELISLFISGAVTDSNELCHAHGEGHTCEHDR